MAPIETSELLADAGDGWDEHALEAQVPVSKSHPLRWQAAGIVLGALVTLVILAVGRRSRDQPLGAAMLWEEESKCSGYVHINGLGEYQLVRAKWNMPGDHAGDISGDGRTVTPMMKGRAYLGERCSHGGFKQSEYAALQLRKKRLTFTADVSAAGCGCNAALYLVSMKSSESESDCEDYYCDAMSVCGLKCAEIDIMEANTVAFHSTLHDGLTTADPKVGLGGGAAFWNGPRDWSPEEYGVMGKCINTQHPFEVSVEFPVDQDDKLKSVDIFLTQNDCKLTASMQQYQEVIDTLDERLKEGMTPVMSYWQSKDMLWLDGVGNDGVPFCKAKSEEDGRRECGSAVRFFDFAVTDVE